MTDVGPAHKVAVLSESLELGGAQRRVVDLVNGFAASGRDVRLVLLRSTGVLGEQLADSVKTVTLNPINPVADLKRFLNRERPDALLAGAAAIHAVAVDAVRDSVPHVPLILRASSHPFRRMPWTLPRQRLLEYVRRRQRIRRYAAADGIIAVAEDVAEAIRAKLPRATIATIPNPVITETFLAGASAPIPWPWSDEDGVPVILSVGRLALAKDFPTLLRGFAMVRQQRPAKLVIVGGGSAKEKRELSGLASRLGLGSEVAFPGETNAVAAWLERADLFVSSSLWEGAPSALIEALAMGCPVVATSSVGSARDLLRNGQLGRLVSPRNPKLLAKAILDELGTRRDPASLKASVASYGVGNRPAQYLAVIDDCALQFGSYGGAEPMRVE
jgi:glycosyltransferase involved in cell wall biosynthesis